MADLDQLDYGILQLLQQDARNRSPVDMAEELPVSAQTVRNRIANLEDAGVIEGYVPVIDYGEAGFPIRIEFTCTAPVKQRSELADGALGISNVVRVEEMLSAKANVNVVAVTDDSAEITPITERLVDLGLTIESERLMAGARVRPFNHFGSDAIGSE